jgi:hypothetical protein
MGSPQLKQQLLQVKPMLPKRVFLDYDLTPQQRAQIRALRANAQFAQQLELAKQRKGTHKVRWEGAECVISVKRGDRWFPIFYHANYPAGMRPDGTSASILTYAAAAAAPQAAAAAAGPAAAAAAGPSSAPAPDAAAEAAAAAAGDR